MKHSNSHPRIIAMVNGLRGSMGKEIAAACFRRGIRIAAISLSGRKGDDVYIRDGIVLDAEPSIESDLRVSLLPCDGNREDRVRSFQATLRPAEDILIAIDFTHPSAVNVNAELYARLKIPFIMGTTGGNRDALYEVTRASGVHAVIAANMCKQIVALQTMLESMSNSFPNAFAGYALSVTESHQSHKADTSGTAKDMVRYFNALRGGEPFPIANITKHRDAASQLSFGVPENALPGHAFHTYRLQSADNTVAFEFKHNVCGRVTYAEGTVDALIFLAGRIADRSEKRIFDMKDILRAGAMN